MKKTVAVASTIDGTKLENTIGRAVTELLSKYEFVYVWPLEDVTWVLKWTEVAGGTAVLLPRFWGSYAAFPPCEAKDAMYDDDSSAFVK